MIPAENDLLTEDLELDEDMPSKDYRLRIEEQRINNYVDELNAMQQVVYKILNTERYDYQVYSWNYGVELRDLFGKHISYVIPEVQRRITEALIQDDRIESVDSFSFERKKGSVLAKFTVHTIFGDFGAESEVEY